MDMTQCQINQQHLRIAMAINKAYQGINNGFITEKQFNTKIATAKAVRNTLRIAQYKLNHA